MDIGRELLIAALDEVGVGHLLQPPILLMLPILNHMNSIHWPDPHHIVCFGLKLGRLVEHFPGCVLEVLIAAEFEHAHFAAHLNDFLDGLLVDFLEQANFETFLEVVAAEILPVLYIRQLPGGVLVEHHNGTEGRRRVVQLVPLLPRRRRRQRTPFRRDA